MLVPDHVYDAMSASSIQVDVQHSHRSQADPSPRFQSTTARWLRGLHKVTLGLLIGTALSNSGGLPHTANIEVSPASVNATIRVVDNMRATGHLVLGQPRVATTTTGTVTASLLYLRTGPGTTYRIIGQMPRGTKLVILGQQPGWYNVRTPMGYVGWASSRYITLDSTPPPSPSPTPIPSPTPTPQPSPTPTPSPSPTPAPPSTIDLSKYATEYATTNGYVYTGRRAQVLHHLKEQFGARVTTYASHSVCPTCSADLWTPDARSGMDNTGLQSMNDMAEYIRANVASLGIRYVIWNQRMSSGGAWQEMADRGSITANHKDHGHITFLDSFQ